MDQLARSFMKSVKRRRSPGVGNAKQTVFQSHILQFLTQFPDRHNRPQFRRSIDELNLQHWLELVSQLSSAASDPRHATSLFVPALEYDFGDYAEPNFLSDTVVHTHRLMSDEPELLKLGKAFHELVQGSWEGPAKNGPETRREEHIPLLMSGDRRRYGRVDLFIDRQSDFVSVIEIKATNWDRVKHRRRLLGAHRRQVLKYVDKYLEGDGLNVCAGIIYPNAPKSAEVRKEVEEYMEGNAIQLLWWDDSSS